jgi:hypothetical protein
MTASRFEPASVSPSDSASARLSRWLASRTVACQLAVSAIAGLALAVAWSATLVDDSIGFNVTNGVLGAGTSAKPLTSTGTGVLFALVTGVAGSFTACNVAGLCAIAPLSASRRGGQDTLKPLGWLAVGACTVAGVYGAVGALIGTSLPQLSADTVGRYPVRILQSTVVFGLIGLVMIVLGLAALGLIRDPLARLSARHARARVVIVGGLIGAFLVGRPYPLFFKLFKEAASTGDPAYGALVFVLQSLGNIAIMALIFLTISTAFHGLIPRWLSAKPGRATAFTAMAFLAAGVFLVSYWVVRVPSHFGIGWWPSMPWT